MSNFSKSSRFHTDGTPVKGRAGVDENLHDPYRLQAKPAEPTWCPQCGAVFEQGRWQWKERLSTKAPRVLCAACARTRDQQPAGIVEIDGEFAHQHHDELMSLVRHHAERAKAEHPMQRIMDIVRSDDGTRITTTDIHLARDLAQALHDAYKGDLALKYSTDEMLLRAHWRR
jgi:NMD protein affecting ribosome stability and mRNA decay